MSSEPRSQYTLQLLLHSLERLPPHVQVCIGLFKDDVERGPTVLTIRAEAQTCG